MDLGALAAGIVGHDPTHRIGGGGEEVSPAVEVLAAKQSEISYVHQGSGIDGVPRGYVGHRRGGELSQLVINDRKDLSRRLAVTGGCVIQELSDLADRGSSLPNARPARTLETSSHAAGPSRPHVRWAAWITSLSR
jgi:hypothetical protein